MKNVSTADILIIDDNKQFCLLLAECVEKLGYHHQYEHTLNDGFQSAQKEQYDIILLDVYLPDGSGLDYLPKFKALPYAPEVIIITGLGDANGAELAIKNEAWGYIHKKCPVRDIQLHIVQALEYRKEKQRTPVATFLFNRDRIIGSSQRLNECLNKMAQAAISDINVLLIGETGTGKELFATAIHKNSKRNGGNFVIVDCAALPENLVESTLFGHEKGAFTGADRSKTGLIKQADGGTLFLDEIGELSLELQKNFLRTLQEKRFRPIGSQKEISSNFRLIAATNRDLDTMVQEGKFREDLFYRLKSFSIELPPLRQRKEDIKEICIHHITKLCDQHGIETKGFSPDFFNSLIAYNWPGNIRELINTLEDVFARTHYETTFYSKHLPHQIRTFIAQSFIQEYPSTNETIEEQCLSKDFPTLKELRQTSIESIEKQYIKDLMHHTTGNVEKACKLAGISSSRFYQLLTKYGFSKPSW